jgi:type III restriction enzyme
MGFTDEEVRETLKPATLEVDDQGHLFDPSERPALVMTHRLPDSEDVRTRLAELAEDGVEYRIDPDGELVVGIRGDVSARVLETLEAVTPETALPTLRAEAERHNERVERGRSRAEKGEVIRVPRLMARSTGSSNLLMSRRSWGSCPGRSCRTRPSLGRRSLPSTGTTT